MLLIPLLGVLGISLFLLWPETKDPQYGGKKLSEWLKDYDFRPKEAREAVQAIGPRAVPFLMEGVALDAGRRFEHRRRMVAKLPPWLRTKTFIMRWVGKRPDAAALRAEIYEAQKAVEGFEILGSKGESAIPKLQRLFSKTSSEMVAANAARSLSYLGPKAMLPLVEVLSDSNQPARKRAWVLRTMCPQGHLNYNATSAVPIITICARDRDRTISSAASWVLTDFATQSPDPTLRGIVAEAIGPFAKDENWADEVLRLLLNDSDEGVRAKAARALKIQVK